MSDDATQVLSPLNWSDPGIHLLDDTWLLTIFAVLLATALPWVLSGFDVNFVAASLGLLVLGTIHFGFSTLGRRSRKGERRGLLTVLHIAGVLTIGFIWINVGGLQNPAFLIVFALPVVGAIFLSRWQPYAMAVIAIVLAGAVALAQIPELRWYEPALSTIGAWLGGALNTDDGSTAPFRGFYAPSAYYIVLLQVFAILLLAAAVASEYLGTILERLRVNLDIARGEAESSQVFWSTLLEDLPVPAFLVEPETLHIVCSSERAREFCSTPPAQNRSIVDTVRFSFPDMIQQLIAADGGVSPLSMIHIGDRLLATEVRVQHTSQQGRRLTLVTIQDKTEEFTTRAALDVIGQAALIIDNNGRIIQFNKPSLALFAGLQKDTDAASLLSLAGMQERWWQPGLSGRRKMHVEIAPRIYQVATSTLPLPGEDEQLYVVTFLPVARAAIADSTAITGTVQQLPDATMVIRSPPTLASHP
jgi:PAS domain-containing protein